MVNVANTCEFNLWACIKVNSHDRGLNTELMNSVFSITDHHQPCVWSSGNYLEGGGGSI